MIRTGAIVRCAALTLRLALLCRENAFCLVRGEVADTLKESTVTGLRALRQAGVNRTDFSEKALKENISLSFADVLAYNSSIFVKQHGRASVSTVSFRGTSASHTQVLWNGLRINSPMLGMTDFSLIPSFLMDSAYLLHGSSSLQQTGGGLGGAVVLDSGGRAPEGFGMQYVQGAGSFGTFDEYLRLSWGGKRLSSTTKAYLGTSENRFRYVNRDKNEIVYDGDMNIVESYHPVEVFDNGAFRDFHLMQETEWEAPEGSLVRFSAWYIDSFRELPRLSVDYSGTDDYINEQRENTLRAVGSWSKDLGGWKTEASAGYAGTYLGYDYARNGGGGIRTWLTRSRSHSNTFFAKAGTERYLGGRWMVSGNVSMHWQSAKSRDLAMFTGDGRKNGYEAGRAEVSAFASLKWKPSRRAGISLSLREDVFGKDFSPVIPALNADFLLSEQWGLFLKGSVSRNYRFPTLNDLYFMPGGNPDLRPESGVSYDIGYSLDRRFGSRGAVRAEGGWFDSYIDDWIMWVPSGAKKDFYTPMNVMRVHAYGLEQKVSGEWSPAGDWKLTFNGNFTWSPSINRGEPRSPLDDSVGKQLVYIPEFSSSFTAGVSWRGWSAMWKWCHYSRRYTMSSNEDSITGSVPAYIMNDLTLGKTLDTRWAGLSMSLAVRNIFNESYQSVLSRPMPGINCEFFIGITPKLSGKKSPVVSE